MSLAGFLYLGDCFGLLNKEALKVEFRHLGGRGMRFEQFPEALLLVTTRSTELALGGQQVPLAEESKMWAKNFRALCSHMLLTKPRDLQKCLDSYRKQEDRPARGASKQEASKGEDRLPNFDPPAVGPLVASPAGSKIEETPRRGDVGNDAFESTLLKGDQDPVVAATEAANAAEAPADAAEAIAGLGGGSVALIEDSGPTVEATEPDSPKKVTAD